jgi:hypothetical protein
MNGSYLGDHLYPSERIERTDPAVTVPQPATNQLADTVPAVEFASPRADVIAVYDYPAQRPPQGETVPVVDVLDETRVMQTPVVEPALYNAAAPVQTPLAETRVNDPTPYRVSQAEIVPPQAVPGANAGALLTHEESAPFRNRWNEIQGKFVDDPRTAVQQADELVTDVIGQITRMFADNHGTLESQWKQGNDVSTEDLRKALQHYRAFFNRLVV